MSREAKEKFGYAVGCVAGFIMIGLVWFGCLAFYATFFYGHRMF